MYRMHRNEGITLNHYTDLSEERAWFFAGFVKDNISNRVRQQENYALDPEASNTLLHRLLYTTTDFIVAFEEGKYLYSAAISVHEGWIWLQRLTNARNVTTKGKITTVLLEYLHEYCKEKSYKGVFFTLNNENASMWMGFERLIKSTPSDERLIKAKNVISQFKCIEEHFWRGEIQMIYYRAVDGVSVPKL